MTMYKEIFCVYKNEVTFILRLSDYVQIPFDPANRDFQEYQEWIALGNQPQPADEPTQG